MHAARSLAAILVVHALAACPALNAVTAAEPTAAAIVLPARALFEGFEARKVVLDAAAEHLLLDQRVFSHGKERTGRAVTDVVDLLPAPNGLGDDCQAAEAVDVEVAAATPAGAAVRVEARSGPHFFDQSGWSPWRDLGGLKGRLAPLAGRYVQFRLSLTAESAEGLPKISAVTLRPAVVVRRAAYEPALTVTASSIQQIVRSPVEFGYERPDQAKLATFRKENDLDGVAAGKYDTAIDAAKYAEIDKSMNGGEDFLRLVRLMDWAAQGRMRNVPGGPQWKDGAYQWDIERVFERTPDGERIVRGHCMSYAQVMVSAATALGYKARHVCAVGFKEMSHEITEVWVPSLGKWVYFDPDLDHYYFDKVTRVPVNLVEMHEVVRDKIVPEDKDMHWLMSRSQEPREHVKGIDTKSLIGCRLGSWLAGAKMPADYDWGWQHGYLIAGFVQMTPRNDFHSHPEKIPQNFQQFPGYDDYPFWVDEKTPPRAGVNEWFTRKRDFYWTVDQASLRLIRTGADEVTVELGNSMPFFAQYHVVAAPPDGAGQPTDSRLPAGPFTWKLRPGENRLTVHPVDEFGKEGTSSTVTVRLGR